MTTTTGSGTVWVCAEGPNGVGKTRLLGGLASRLTGRCRLVTELTDAGGVDVAAQVISALSTGESFLRTGHPLTETFALIALKVREHELVRQMTTPPEVVLEDRGIDTTALYQAAILLGPDADDQATWELAQQIYATAECWRPKPDLVLLILDDFDTCRRRYADRVGHPMTNDERRLIARVTRLYRRQAAHEPDRFTIVHRAGRSEQHVLDELEQLVLDQIGARQ